MFGIRLEVGKHYTNNRDEDNTIRESRWCDDRQQMIFEDEDGREYLGNGKVLSPYSAANDLLIETTTPRLHATPNWK